MTEVWRAVPSLPEYLASSEGRVMRVPWVGQMFKGGKRSFGGQPIFGAWHKDTKRFQISYKGKNYRVAIMVCEAFHGPKPYPKQVCMHLDENSRNNRPENLAWGTQKQNLNAPGFIEYCKGRTGENNPYTKGRK